MTSPADLVLFLPKRHALITEANLDDITAINSLVNSAYRGDSSRIGWTTEADFLDGTRIFPDELANLLQAPGSTILKYQHDQGHIIGCVNLQWKEQEMYLGLLTVHPQFQSQGIGRQLLVAAERFALLQGCTGMKMTVISIRDTLIAWYARNGYAATGERMPFPTGDPRFGIPLKPLEFIVMKKKLLPAAGS